MFLNGNSLMASPPDNMELLHAVPYIQVELFAGVTCMAHIPSRGGQCHADLLWGVRSRAPGLSATFWLAFWHRWHRPPRLIHVGHLVRPWIAAARSYPPGAGVSVMSFKKYLLPQESRQAWPNPLGLVIRVQRIARLGYADAAYGRPERKLRDSAAPVTNVSYPAPGPVTVTN